MSTFHFTDEQCEVLVESLYELTHKLMRKEEYIQFKKDLPKDHINNVREEIAIKKQVIQELLSTPVSEEK